MSIFSKNKKGFTLIELLVVISIISLLASVVLASVKQARFKAFDTSIRQNLSAIRTQASIYYGNNGNSYGEEFGVASCEGMSYDNLFRDQSIALAISAVQRIVGNGEDNMGLGVLCGLLDGEWVVAAPLMYESSYYWCIDSTGNAKVIPDGNDIANIVQAGSDSFLCEEIIN